MIDWSQPLELEDGTAVHLAAPFDSNRHSKWGASVKIVGVPWRDGADEGDVEELLGEALDDDHANRTWYYRTDDGVWDGDEYGVMKRLRNAELGPEEVESWRL